MLCLTEDSYGLIIRWRVRNVDKRRAFYWPSSERYTFWTRAHGHTYLSYDNFTEADVMIWLATGKLP